MDVEFVLKNDLKQKHVEAYEAELDKLGVTSATTFRIRSMGNALRAGIAAGWIESPETKHSGDIYIYDGVSVDEIDPRSGIVQVVGRAIQMRWLDYIAPQKN